MRCIAVCILSIPALAQPPSGTRFEVASIKAAPTLAELRQSSQLAHLGLKITGRRVEIGALSLAELVVIAYKIEPHQLVGPDWMLATRFDILATVPEGAHREDVPDLLRG